jgi:predicted N-formylglutamate amidohydrolase
VGSSTSIPELSEATIIPGNMNLSAAERQRRITTWFDPFHQQLGHLLDACQRATRPTVIVTIHSFTPVFLGLDRPMGAGILYRRSQRFGAALVAALGAEAAGIAHNAPFEIDDESDYSIPVHGESRGREAVLIEIRQDLLQTPKHFHHWAQALAEALPKSLDMATRQRKSKLRLTGK